MHDKETMLAAYRRVSLEELWKIVNSVEDALVRWESRAANEPSLRIRIREGYDALKVVQEAIAERTSATTPNIEVH